MIRAVIIDDEPNNVNSLQVILKKFCPEINIVGTADNANSAFDLINETSPQLLFLDIEMPYGNAFDLLNRLNNINFEIIFITAFDTYAIKAFKYSALDYLLKPINIEDLKKAVQRVSKFVNNGLINDKVINLLQNMNTSTEMTLKKLALPTMDGLIFLKTQDIIRLEASGSYSIIHVVNKQPIIVTKPLGSFEELLQENLFCRIHHSHIINLDYIKKYNKGRGGTVEMEDGVNIEVSVRKKDFFLEKFKM